MLNLFTTISGLVIIINIIYSIIPSEKYANYCKIVIGLITMLAVINMFSGALEWNFTNNYQDTFTSIEENNSIIFEEIVFDNLKNNIQQHIVEKFGDVVKNVKITYDQYNIDNIVIQIIASELTDEIKNEVALYCDINCEKVVIECL